MLYALYVLVSCFVIKVRQTFWETDEIVYANSVNKNIYDILAIFCLKDARSDTLLIGHTYFSMLSIQNELTLQKELQNVMTINVQCDN